MKSGTCGFCGIGDGWLGEQGDESSQYLHSSVRTGTPGDWKYTPHENALDGDNQYIMWCGSCVRGLIHKYQRYDDTNLRALLLSTQLRLELDGIRWTLWSAEGDERDALKKTQDDPSIHLDKLSLESNLYHMQAEQSRRYGLDLTLTGRWRP